MSFFLQLLVATPLWVKRSVLLSADALFLVLALWTSFSLRLGEWYWPPEELESRIIGVVMVAPVIAIPIFVRFGLYRAIIRYLGMRAAWSVIQAVALYAVLWGLFAMLSGVPGIPRSVVLINAMVALLLVGGGRAMMRWMLSQVHAEQQDSGRMVQTRTVIYGAGEAGRQLAIGLGHSRRYRLCGFVDDDKELHGRDLMGVPILSSEQLKPFIERRGVTDLLLAIPSITRQQRNRVLEGLRPLPLRIRTLPGLDALAKGEAQLSDLHELEVDDLLEREAAEPDEELLQQQVSGKTVLVTGAGGSIGSELCRQILKRRPKVLLLLDNSEYALYQIEQRLVNQLHALVNEEERQGISLVPRVVALTGAVQDEERMIAVLQAWKVDVIYHAAARKHVPLSESNVAETIVNNVLGTLSVAKSAILLGVPNMVLISTDKAVRPTNLMGASKRCAEMILQALVNEKKPSFEQVGGEVMQVERMTHLSMVRFGNVLGSSGSVVPKFRQQIRDGGPITLTDREIIRYFMTIPEASQLVMQAGAMSGEEEDAAEVFVLDMGEPVKIYDLACRMVELSGLRVRENDSPEGDIEIKVVGLRPGEKLYEELLIGNNPLPTQHPRIMKAHEELITWSELEPKINSLHVAAQSGDVEMIRSLMQNIVKGYLPDQEIVDSIYREQIRNAAE